MIRKLLRFLFGAVPEATVRPDCPFEASWRQSWDDIGLALSVYDQFRSCSFVYQALALTVCLETLSVDQAKELLDSSLGAFAQAKHKGRRTQIDEWRINSLRYELRRRRRLPRVVRPRVAPSDN